jgi:AP-4 complex subunit epsilon-1
MHPHSRPLLSSTGECKNKSDEDAIMRREIIMLRSILASPKLERSKLKEYLIRLMYVEMLGHDASFGYIHAVKATHEPDLALKRVGYLATSAFLHENHDLIILIVNTVQQDLKDDNYLVVCAALTTVCRLVNEETIPAVLPQVTELLSHPKEHVRKKAVMALHRFHQRSPASVAHLQSKFRQMLCDKDPSVMAAALCALHDLIAVDPTPHKNLIPSFVSILKQIVEHRLPKSYDYHRVPAPFVQIKLLKILAALGTADKTASSEMYSVLSSTLKKADNQANIGNAIVYECVRTAATIYPSPVLLEHCASVVSRFVKSPKNNLKYVGLDSLSCVVNINPKYAVEHQMAVVDCLTDPDESLRKKTLDLLYRMTKSHNVEVIVEKMTEFLRSATDRHTREETVNRIGELAERYAPTTRWFIETMNTMFAIGGDVVKPVTAHNLMRLIGEGSGDDGADAALRASAVSSYLDILDANPKIPKVLLEVIIWVVGEYGTLSGKSAVELMDALCAAVEAQSAGDAVRAQAMTACVKLAAAGGGGLSGAAARLTERCANSRDVDKQQRAHEILALLRESPATVAAALPRDASAEELEVDAASPSLDAYVARALANGASAYQPPSERSTGLREGDGRVAERGNLRFDAYDAPTAAGGAYDPHVPTTTAASAEAFGASLNKREGSWGQGSGYGGAPAAAVAAPAAAPGAVSTPNAVMTIPEEPDDRALLADALFSGGGPAAPAAVSKPAAAPAPTPTPANPMDLLMGLDAPGTSSTHAPAPVPSAGPVADLLGGLDALSVGGGPPAYDITGAPPATPTMPGAMQQTGYPGQMMGMGVQPPQMGMGGVGMHGGVPQQSGLGQMGGMASPGASTIPAHLRDRTPPKKNDPFADLLG